MRVSRLTVGLVALYYVLVVPGLVLLAGTPTHLHPEENCGCAPRNDSQTMEA
jgi:hypothetical protein